jgi:uracil-DNA glycosylase family 4
VTRRASAIDRLGREIAACRRCPRLVEYCAEVARTRKRAHRDEEYWGRPVPGFGDPAARVVLVGLAPGAHGANRTGRMFTGDGTDGGGASDFLARAMHTAGIANRDTSRDRDDGLRLRGVFLTAICRCAPPANRPTRAEIETCGTWLHTELDVLVPRVLVCLGKLSFDQTLRVLAARGAGIPRPRPRFGHGSEWDPGAPHPLVLCSYHPSRQVTAPGRLTQAMLVDVLRRALANT